MQSKGGTLGFIYICLRKEIIFFTMFFNGSNIENLNMIHSAEMLRPQNY